MKHIFVNTTFLRTIVIYLSNNTNGKREGSIS